MPEVKKQIKTFVVDFQCNECKQGGMRPTGEVTESTEGEIYSHKCTACGKSEAFVGRTYPYKYDEYV